MGKICCFNKKGVRKIKRLTTDEARKKVMQNNQYVDLIGEYVNNNTKIKCLCKICGEEYYANPSDVFSGKIHISCAQKNAANKRTKTTAQFIDELFVINANIKVIGDYVNAYTKIECLCMIHNEYFSSSPTHLLAGQTGCKCCKSEKITHIRMMDKNEFMERVAIKSPNTTIIGEYKGCKNRILVECKTCLYQWNPVASSVINGYGCPKCSHRIMTHEDFVSMIQSINPYIRIEEQYKGADKKIKCSCIICGNTFSKQAHSLKRTGCPYCNMSHGELKINQWLTKNNIRFETQKTFIDLFGTKGGLLSYDFYIPSNNMLIEYNGEFHDGSVKMQSMSQYKIQSEHDKRKKEYAINNNIKLLIIWYYDYDNIEDILLQNI